MAARFTSTCSDYAPRTVNKHTDRGFPWGLPAGPPNCARGFAPSNWQTGLSDNAASSARLSRSSAITRRDVRSSCPEVQSAKAMSGADPNAFSLDIDTVQLTRALKHLRKFASQGEVVCLKYDAGTLTVSMGRTSRDVPATGTWPWPLCVVRPWADALATNPFEPSITVLRHADGKLWARGFGVECSLEPCEEEGEEVVKREENIDLACQILASYKVTKLEVIALIDEIG